MKSNEAEVRMKKLGFFPTACKAIPDGPGFVFNYRASSEDYALATTLPSK